MLAVFAQEKPAQPRKLPRAQRLDRGLRFWRDPATGELHAGVGKPANAHSGPVPEAAAGVAIRAEVRLVEVGCNVVRRDGAPVHGLGQSDFRVFEDGIEQSVAHFDAASAPARIALVIDASPSVFRELEETKAAARTLAEQLAPRDEVAVVAFAGEVHLLLPFSRDRAQLEDAFASSELARVANSRESNIYLAIYLAAQLFREPARPGRKAIVVLTDGQDSGLGLSWDPASAAPQPGERASRLTFEDVTRALAANGIEVYAISSQTRPLAMTNQWLEAHQAASLVSPATRELGMPHYTVYLAELIRRAGGQLLFLRESRTLSDVYRHIAGRLESQYILGYYPPAGSRKPGWHALRVELAEAAQRRTELVGARVLFRAGYYVPSEP